MTLALVTSMHLYQHEKPPWKPVVETRQLTVTSTLIVTSSIMSRDFLSSHGTRCQLPQVTVPTPTHVQHRHGSWNSLVPAKNCRNKKSTPNISEHACQYGAARVSRPVLSIVYTVEHCFRWVHSLFVFFVVFFSPVTGANVRACAHRPREPVKTATLQNGHNQNGHTEWSHYQNGHTTLVKTATLLWSKRPHRMGSCQNGHAFFGQNGHTLMVKTATRWALPKWAEVATTTATLHLVKTATNNEWYQFCEEWITECVYVTPQNVHNFIVLNWLISVS